MPTQLNIVPGLRVAGPVQLSRFANSVRMTQGNWTSVDGIMLAFTAACHVSS
jgi:hypothetical protein